MRTLRPSLDIGTQPSDQRQMTTTTTSVPPPTLPLNTLCPPSYSAATPLLTTTSFIIHIVIIPIVSSSDRDKNVGWHDYPRGIAPTSRWHPVILVRSRPARSPRQRGSRRGLNVTLYTGLVAPLFAQTCTLPEMKCIQHQRSTQHYDHDHDHDYDRHRPQGSEGNTQLNSTSSPQTSDGPVWTPTPTTISTTTTTTRVVRKSAAGLKKIPAQLPVPQVSPRPHAKACSKCPTVTHIPLIFHSCPTPLPSS